MLYLVEAMRVDHSINAKIADIDMMNTSPKAVAKSKDAIAIHSKLSTS